MNTNGEHPGADLRGENPALASAAVDALDALVEAGFDSSRVDPDLRARAARLSEMLSLLDEGGAWPASADASGGSLADRILASIRDGYERESELTINDGEALEALIMSGYDPARTPGALRKRAGVHADLSRAVVTLGAEHEQWISAGRAVRTEAVLGAVTSADSAVFGFERSRPRRAVRFMDFVAAAAMVLLASAVALPVLNSFSEEGRRRVCVSNLQAAGLGIGLYAMSNDDALPMATAGFGGSWSQVGTPGRSHSANLFQLVRTKHVMPWDLACPGNEHAPHGTLGEDDVDWGSVEEVSYSYRLMPRGRNLVRLLDSDAVVLADRSPMLLAGMRGQSISPEASSANHNREGQFLLAIDESVRWVETPVLQSGDNIWLPRAVEEVIHSVRKKYGYVDGYELPSSPDDAFLGP